jgi:hypothetical protein
MKTSHIYAVLLLSVPRELGIFMVLVIYESSDEDGSRRGRKAVEIMAEALCEEFIQSVSTVGPFPRDIEDLLPDAVWRVPAPANVMMYLSSQV